MFTSKYKSIIRLGLVATILLSVFLNSKAFAFTELVNRTLSISSSVGGATNTHVFSFEFPDVTNIGSISFEYCDDPIDTITCVNPPGSDISGAVLSSQTGASGFTIVSQTTNKIIIGRPPTGVSAGLNSYTFDNVVNPSNKGPFFVRIMTFASSDGTGTGISYGATAGSINTSILINAEVPDILYFCATVVIPTNCSDAVGDFVDFGTFRTTATRFATSQFLVGTNAVNGYSVVTNGPPLSAGKFVIPGGSSPDISRIGTSQFGINLRANLSPLIGADPAGISGFTGTPMASYNTPNKYMYKDGDIIATSNTRSEIGIFTVSYVVNINAIQHPGVYNTTLTFVCTAGF